MADEKDETINMQSDTEHVVKSTKSGDGMTRTRAVLIMVAASMIFFLFGVQFSAFSAYYVVMTQYFEVGKATAGWIGSVQFGMGCLLGTLHEKMTELLQILHLILTTNYTICLNIAHKL